MNVGVIVQRVGFSGIGGQLHSPVKLKIRRLIAVQVTDCFSVDNLHSSVEPTMAIGGASD